MARRRDPESILVWLNADFNPENAEELQSFENLKNIISDVKVVQNTSDCVELLKTLVPTKCFVITSGWFGQLLIPQIHSFDYLESIFLLCGNEKYHQAWSSQWSKIRGIHVNIRSLCDQLKTVIHQVDHDNVNMSFLSTDDDGSILDLNRLDPSFMYTALLKDVFFDIEFTRVHIENMVSICREKYANNKTEMRIIEEFSRQYTEDDAIRWYTRACFLFYEVNRALRELDGGSIIDMGFFIHELNRQIKFLYYEQILAVKSQLVVVYRGQGMKEKDFQKLKKSKNGLLGFNSFLSTSRSRDVSFRFCTQGAERPGHIGILFTISIDPTLQVTPFADVQQHSYFEDENEVLFAMNSIFRIGDIKPISEYSNIYEVSLFLTSDDDPQLNSLKTFMSERVSGLPENRLGWILKEMGCYERCEKLYTDLLQKATDDADIGFYNHQLGAIKDFQGKYAESIEFYRRTLEIDRKRLPPDHMDLAKTFNCMGLVYNNLAAYPEAREHFERSLEIRLKNLPNKHADLAPVYNNLGLVYDNMHLYAESLKNYELALEIKMMNLPENHPSLATTYDNIGLVHSNMGNYPPALTNHKKALEIYLNSLPENHPDTAMCYQNIGVVYSNMQNYSLALQYFQKSLSMLQASVPATHPNIQIVKDNIEKAMEFL